MSTTIDRYFGGARHHTLAAGEELRLDHSSRVRVVNATGAGAVIFMPDARRLPFRTGGPHYFILNIGAHDITVRNAAGVQFGTVAPGNWGEVKLSNRGTLAGVWHIQNSTGGGGGGFTTCSSATTTTAATTTTTAATTTTTVPPTTTTTGTTSTAGITL